MKIRWLAPFFTFALVAGLITVPPGAAAAPIAFFADLSGAAEEPPVPSPGIGLVEVIIDPVAHTMDISAFFAGLVGSTTAAHIHVINGPGDANTADTLGPVATTTPSFVGFPLGVTAGAYDDLLDTLASGSYNPGFVTDSGGIAQAEAALFAAILEGRAYFNIHTSFRPGGEIRGFLTPVPEPASLVLLSLTAGGSVVVAALRNRRAR